MGDPADELVDNSAYRDAYSLWIEGPALDRDRVEAILDRLRRDRAAEAGNEARRRRALERSTPFPPPAIGLMTFHAIRSPLEGLLLYLLGKRPALRAAGMTDLTIRALMTRGPQLGSELSRREIALLHDLDASFCWNIILGE